MDLTADLAHDQVSILDPQHCHVDERVSHITKDEEIDLPKPTSKSEAPTRVQALIQDEKCLENIVGAIQSALCCRMDAIL